MTSSIRTFVIVFLGLVVTIRGQIFTQSYNLITSPAYHVSPGIIQAPTAVDTKSLAHRAVVENALAESQLPSELLNPFYKNPTIAAGLAKESWFGDKEFPVLHREAEKIPRTEILKIVRRIQHLDRKR